MPSHFWWANAWSHWESMERHALSAALVMAGIGIAMSCSVALSLAADRRAGAADSVDTEHLFGFTEGSSIGTEGEAELESDSTFRFGKRSGSFADAASELEFKYTAFQSFRISPTATFAYYDIGGVVGFEDRRQAAVQSLSLDARFRLLDREHSPVGLTLSVDPHWGFGDEASGVRINHFGVEAILRADREIVADRLFGALNLVFDTDRTHPLASGGVEQQPTIGVGTALAAQVKHGVWIGAEVRYLRAYEGAALSTLSGQGVYMGPTLYARLGQKGWMSAAWNLQVWDAAVGTPGALDLANFERHQFKFRLGYEF